MKNISFLIAILLTSNLTNAQVKLGNTPGTINSKSLLELESTSKGLLFPRMNTTQMNTIGTVQGMTIYNTDSNCLCTNNGSIWVNLCSGTSGSGTDNQGISINSSKGTITLQRGGYIMLGDSITGNEITDTITNGFLQKTGLGTSASPYKTGLKNGILNGDIIQWNGAKWVSQKYRTQWIDTQNIIGLRSIVNNANNIATGQYSFAIGQSDTASGGFSIAMGKNSKASGFSSTVIGDSCLATGTYSFVTGHQNKTLGYGSFGSGELNNTLGDYSTTLGYNNSTSGPYSLTIGYNNNTGGQLSLNSGYGNNVNGSYSFSAGSSNTSSGTLASTIGASNTASGNYTLASGYSNLSSGGVSTSLGWSNIASGTPSLATGYYDTASAPYSTVIGKNSKANGFASIALGDSVVASGKWSLATGNWTRATGDYSSVFGYNSKATGIYCTALGNGTTSSGTGNIAAGIGSIASGSYSFAHGWYCNAAGNISFAYGDACLASGSYSTAIGRFNKASGFGSMALGYNDTSLVNYSYTLGNYVSSHTYTGTLTLGDQSTTTTMRNSANNRFQSRYAGGYYLYTNSAVSVGVSIGAGGNSWSSISDSSKKTDLLPINGEDFLTKIANIKLSSWRYKSQDNSFRHYGPMAQDFYAAFGKDKLGTIGCDTLIASADFDGINFIAIQALEKRTQEINVLKQQNTELIKNFNLLLSKLDYLEKIIEETKSDNTLSTR